MAGTHIKIDDSQVVNVLNQLLRRSGDLTPFLEDVGELLDVSHDKRFDRQVSPDGQAWETLSDVTLGKKEKNSDKVLTEYGTLRESLHPQIKNKNTLLFGTNVIYAAVHQFGAEKGAFSQNTPWGDIPARPFLGISAEDKNNIRNLLFEYLNHAFS